MSVREKFENIKMLSTLIDNKLEEIASLRGIATSITGVLQDVPGHAKGLTSDKVGDTTAKIVDLENEMMQDVNKLMDLRRESLKLVDKLDEPDEQRIVYLRYFKFLTWSKIADETHYTREGARKICFRAVDKLEKELTKNYRS